MVKRENKPTITKGSGNAFADIGHPNPQEAAAKSDLAKQIYLAIKSKKLTQSAAAKILGIDQPKVSDIVCGRLSRFSIDRLMRFLRLLGNDIEIRIKKTKKNPSNTSLTVIRSDSPSYDKRMTA